MKAVLPSGGSTAQQTNARQAVGSPECHGFPPTSHPRYLHLQVRERRGGEGRGGRGGEGELACPYGDKHTPTLPFLQ